MYPLSVKQTYLAVFNSSASSAAVPGLATDPFSIRLPVTWLNTIWLNFFQVGGNRSKERDRKSELVLRSTYQILNGIETTWIEIFITTSDMFTYP